MSPIMKLLNQFEKVLRATPLALREDGKISPGMAQGLREERSSQIEGTLLKPFILLNLLTLVPK